MINRRTDHLVTAALFAALTALCSQISLPIGPVPFNLATFSALLSGALLGAKWGAISQLIYILLGAVGVPVFAGFMSGLPRLAGPTGGYIIGYVAAAFITGLWVDCISSSRTGLIPGMVLGLLALYVLGTKWYMTLTGSDLLPALMVCVFPFLLGEVLKVALATELARRLAPILRGPAQQ